MGQARQGRAAALWRERGSHFSHKKKESVRKEQLPDSLPLGNEQTSAKIVPGATASTHPCPHQPAAWGRGLQRTTPSHGEAARLGPRRRWARWSRAASALNAAGPTECLRLGSALGGKMPFWACAWKCSLGLGWSVDVRGVHSVVTGTGCPGAGGTAAGNPNPGNDPGGSPASAPGFAPKAAAALLPRGVGSAPGRALCYHHCPSGCPSLTAPQGCPAAGAGLGAPRHRAIRLPR